MFSMSAPVTRVNATQALHVAREELADDVLDVSAGAERATFAGDDDRRALALRVERGERVGELLVDRERERVQSIGAIERDLRDAARDARSETSSARSLMRRSSVSARPLRSLPRMRRRSFCSCDVERRERALHRARVLRDDLLHERSTFAREVNARDAPIARSASFDDEPVARGAIDEAREVARRDEEIRRQSDASVCPSWRSRLASRSKRAIVRIGGGARRGAPRACDW